MPTCRVRNQVALLGEAVVGTNDGVATDLECAGKRARRGDRRVGKQSVVQHRLNDGLPYLHVKGPACVAFERAQLLPWHLILRFQYGSPPLRGPVFCGGGAS